MARIIEMGNVKKLAEPRSPLVLCGKCGRCGCVFEIGEHELSEKEIKDTPAGVLYSAKCPQPGCGQAGIPVTAKVETKRKAKADDEEKGKE